MENLAVIFKSTLLVAATEMGDKTQLSTVDLAADYKKPFLVTIGTTIGMMLSDGLVVFYVQFMEYSMRRRRQ